MLSEILQKIERQDGINCDKNLLQAGERCRNGGGKICRGSSRFLRFMVVASGKTWYNKNR
jgi:hypothetical protein